MCLEQHGIQRSDQRVVTAFNGMPEVGTCLVLRSGVARSVLASHGAVERLGACMASQLSGGVQTIP